MQKSSVRPASDAEERVLPSAHPPVAPSPDSGLWGQIVALVRYLVQSEVHTYAFSVAACALLSLFPFIVMMYTIAQYVFHSQGMWRVIGDMIRFFLPTTHSDQEFVVKNMGLVVSGHHHIALISLVTLFISCTGVFLPLEVALNQVWGVAKSRSYLANQVISLGLAVLMAALATTVAVLNATQRSLLALLFLGHTDNIPFRLAALSLLEVTTVLASIAMFFFTYWLLPNRKIPALAVLPTAITTGLIWESCKFAYIYALPHLDLRSAYGPFETSVGIMMWAYVSGLLLLGGAHYSASRYARRLASQAQLEEQSNVVVA
ncbi:MAG TPA: YihY/virulence factor BrkB family protein [Acidisarcina sp.]|nr:YihY/virulence factor BrkB family protein [Acidisarcina sp.]